MHAPPAEGELEDDGHRQPDKPDCVSRADAPADLRASGLPLGSRRLPPPVSQRVPYFALESVCMTPNMFPSGSSNTRI